MKLINSSFEILNPTGNIYTDIERAARICYKSEDKITEGSAEKFVKTLINSKHFAMLEHATIYLKVEDNININIDIIESFIQNPHSEINFIDNFAYITTNYRVILENYSEVDLREFICEETEFHIKRVSVKFITDRGISHELVRHRKYSFAQESTRFCNYTKGKFGNELTFIEPFWLEGFTGFLCKIFFKLSEKLYRYLIKKGWSPQEARTILPNALKTEILLTGTLKQWEDFFALRCTNAAHPQMRELVIPLQLEFKNRKWITY
jgi:thymidylate synthase (FAD)